MKHILPFILLLFSFNSLSQSTLLDSVHGCRYSLPWSCDGCELNWTGACIDSIPSGRGVLTITYQNDTVMEYNGEMNHGQFNGVGRYRDAMNEMQGLFADGQFISNDTTILADLEKVLVSDEDPHSLYINDGEANTKLFYYKMTPESPRGGLVIIPSAGETLEYMIQQIDLHRVAFENGLMVILPSMNWGTMDRRAENAFLDNIFKQVVEQHSVPPDKFVFCGFSNGGMISFRYAIDGVKDNSTFLIPKGIIGVDPPLDFARLYRYCEREIQRDLSPGGLAEAKWMLNRYNSVYGGSPAKYPEAYIKASTFSYGVEQGGNAKYLTNIAIRMHSDLNTDYLINQRGRDLYDWNGLDIVAFVNQLKINGNDNAEVVITQNKGIRPDGSMNPHSWSIMDTDETLQWILNLLEEEE